MVATRDRAVGVRGHDYKRRGLWRLHGVGDEVGREPRKPAQPALLPRRDEPPHDLVVLDSRARPRER